MVTLSVQTADLHRQRFESSFFELLRLMRELRAEVHFVHSAEFDKSHADGFSAGSITVHKSSDGLEAFTQSVLEIIYQINLNKVADGDRDGLIKIYLDTVHRTSEATLGPYFRIIYTMLYKIRSDTTLIYKEKCFYGNLLRSQLTSREILYWLLMD
jgi:hypothetical protein